MANNVTTYDDIINSFHSTFQDKAVIPEALEKEWCLKAIGRYSHEISELNFDEDLLCFNIKLDRYVVDTLGLLMKKFYQERELSKANKRISIVGKDISINSGMSNSKYAENELAQVTTEVDEMLYRQTPTAYN